MTDAEYLVALDDLMADLSNAIQEMERRGEAANMVQVLRDASEAAFKTARPIHEKLHGRN